MEQIRVVPKDLLCLIPKFEGEENLLNLFIRKAQYIYAGFADSNNPVQSLYVFYAITSRLAGRAAALLSEREDVNTWDVLRDLLIQHFGDPRSEECIAIELEQLKLKHGESYKEFCHRIQHMRSTLFAKVNLLRDEGVKAAKMIIYNNMCMNVFLFNLPEDLIRVVRLKQCGSLEIALSVVIEEVNFINQCSAKKQTKPAPTPQNFKPTQSMQPAILPSFAPNFKFGNPQFGQPNKFQTPNQNFKFGIPHQPQITPRFGSPNQQNPSGWKFNQNSGPQNYRFGIPNQQQKFGFGIPTQNQGFRPPMNNFARHPPGFQPQNNFKFGIPHQNVQSQKPTLDTDVSMRTARPLRQNMIDGSHEADNSNVFYNNEADVSPDCYEYQDVTYNENYMYNLDTPQMAIEPYAETPEVYYQEVDSCDVENFQAQASSYHPK